MTIIIQFSFSCKRLHLFWKNTVCMLGWQQQQRQRQQKEAVRRNVVILVLRVTFIDDDLMISWIQNWKSKDAPLFLQLTFFYYHLFFYFTFCVDAVCCPWHSSFWCLFVSFIIIFSPFWCVCLLDNLIYCIHIYFFFFSFFLLGCVCVFISFISSCLLLVKGVSEPSTQHNGASTTWRAGEKGGV